jgi:hypothetical protein
MKKFKAGDAMKCINCGHELVQKDKFCGQCGISLINEAQVTASYLDEMQRIAQEQNESRVDDEVVDDLNTPIGLLRAQVRLLTSLYRRVEKLEQAQHTERNVQVIDFDMPFWSLFGFEFKVFLVSLFYMVIFYCLFFLMFSLTLKDVAIPFFQQFFSF